ncbi:hypothetical protein HMJ29_00435 [Hymenobacter taeanensis]|uniref:Uncharacterized protein n=1 Tax=Hymenobacter taeanensis TaxID=2735321 RepID=A0A6M6BCG1_9BACT|nr:MULTISPECIES: hypothetical protein [Hymenobacter]QJX45484.1 hypothetical protein HMJ29_00435 [Hymenobacter taeanensis]UOQ81268.1 hypothetical protein MUN83_00260 [Hymenobacter sp. 5414T-23]
MKKTCFALLNLLLTATYSNAETHHQLTMMGSSNEPTVADQQKQVGARALQLTCYFTDVLRLTQQQAAAVRVVTLQKLQQLDPTAQGQANAKALRPVAIVLAQYDAAMLHILTSGQYSTFRWIEERQPVSQLLAGSAK